MIQEPKQMCRACATGIEKFGHNSDPKTCIRGKEEYIKNLSVEDQMEQLIIHERLSQEMACFILSLANERHKSPLEVIQEEGLNLLTE